eukprot:9648535-Ditylum_brightwellii.AAC.2
MKELEVNVMGFAETNILWRPQDIYTAMCKLRQEFHAKSKLITAASKDPTIVKYQTGGVMMAVGGQHMGRALDAKEGIAGLGRWSWICLGCKRTNLYLVTA